MTGLAPTRMCAILLNDHHLALIRRERPDGVQHSLPGGLLQLGEDPYAALRRELLEELGLDPDDLPVPPVLRFIQEQETQRPGEAARFRRRHLVFTARLPDHLHRAVAAVEQDDPGRAPVEWIPLADAVGLHLYPAVGPVLHQAAEPAAGPVLLAPMTSTSYQWR
ncbi:NUDIX hydrolase [Kitasatospora purpeofusca]|uniref:NUDIX hydrolase n=1 Tax=Kitasatospora purpeofusca TaxID=67352 RepID=UPI002E0E6522|nr:NUDIX hydrolase [Kitasatospora purpeofusca]